MQSRDPREIPRGSAAGSSAGGPSSPPMNITVETAQMSDDTLELVLEFATAGFEKCNSNVQVTKYIKYNLDIFENPSWHCIIGDFSLSISHEIEKFAYLSRGATKICVYKTAKAAIYKYR